ncbi:GGDEF domain-containing protein [Wenzhouxiangella sp. AB-CW3]|uniref:GGDEF domain-containing protein n=1 Tax=Wenzhouxiangella sp. AB-CW3 TaxID=2771012 RepID=UPI00168ACB7B|nr:GGDEF domain-containing protein [Wenzhouxiangella sp. AB-CW3]QOC22163.1 GGDEF domain-containing protein [Wenzhouxiangella sp. AB-CW3]
MRVLLVLLLGCCLTVARADVCVSLLDTAAEIRELRNEDADLGVSRGEEALERIYRQDVDCPQAKVALLSALAANLHVKGRFHEALVYVRRALELLERAPEHRADVHLMAGVLHWELEEHDEAIAHYLSARRASEDAGDVIAAARAAGNIGNLYNTMGDYVRAREHHQRALEWFRESGWQEGVAGTLVNLAALAGRQAGSFESLGDDTSAGVEYEQMLEFARQGLALFETLDNSRGVAHARTNLAEALSGLRRFDEALEHQSAAIDKLREIGDAGGEARGLLNLGRIHRSGGRYDKAAETLQQAIDRNPYENVMLHYDVIEQLAELKEAQGNYQAALDHQKTLNLLRRQIAEGQMSARVEETRLAMEADQREQDLALLRSEAEISKLELERQRILTMLTVLLVILLLVLLGLLLRLYRDRVRRSRQLEQVARTDSLTGLVNRRGMTERLESAHEGCRVTGDRHAIIVADIDGFKQINDHHGHAVGDEVLKHVADLLVDGVRGRDVVARWGGEEFLILLPNTDRAGAAAVAGQLVARVASNPASTEVGQMPLSMTLGVSELSHDDSVGEAVRRADAAMYRGKQAGKNRHVTDEDLT